MKKKFWSSEKLLSLSALFVSLLTLMVFMYQTDLIRKQQYMSVYPHLSFINYRSGSADYQFALKNDGIGPAIIRKIEVKERNGTVHPSLMDYVLSQLTEEDSIRLITSDIHAGTLLPAQKEIILFQLETDPAREAHHPRDIAGAIKLRSILNTDSLDIKLVYQSIYEEQWEVTSHSVGPKKL